METKRCSKCGEEKILLAFSCNSASKDGLDARCRDCIRVAHRHWYAVHAKPRKVKSQYPLTEHERPPKSE